jgi:hypothetical protein
MRLSDGTGQGSSTKVVLPWLWQHVVT